MGLKLKYGFLTALTLVASMAWADTLQLKNGSLIKGKFLGGTQTEISFQVGSTVQKYNVADIISLKFDSEGGASAPAPQPQSSLPDDPATVAHVATKPAYVTIPAGTLISVRTIDAIDSAYNLVGDRFLASLEEPLTLEGNVVVAKDVPVYGRLTQAKESGTFTGRSQLRLELTGIVVNGKMVPVVTGEYEVTGKSRGASTAKRTAGGAALGAIIGAVADGGQGAAIGAGAGATAGAASEIITGGDQVKVPSETLLDFTLLQDVSIPTRKS
ncbi:MAG TPA: YMGG-like glycine zipper-containing protein [Edaphobacter sp.]|nr:YMGG-like glycine zipper-containing protein [Edaphobacter sp.]